LEFVLSASRIRGQLAAVIVVGLLSTALQSQVVADEWSWSGVERIVAIGDVHGAYEALTRTLAEAGVLNEELGWNGGTTNLVFTGDILDRGAHSRKVMDLIMRLEGEALDAGGRVHMLLGNHEVMNLVGDLRYVSKEEFAAFSEDESPIDRKRWFRKRSDGNSVVSNERVQRQEFAKKCPPGYFGLRRAFGPQGVYGSWLMSKPFIVVINGTAFVHGGLSSLIAELGLDGVNRTLKSQVNDYVTQMEVLNDAGILDPTESFYRHQKLLEPLASNGRQAESIKKAINTIIDLNDASIHSRSSPIWYRGTAACGPLIEEDKLAAALEALGANRVVIGHTPTLTRQVLERMDGRVVEIDTGMLNAAYGGSGSALIIEGDSVTVVGEKASAPYIPYVHPRRVGYRSDTLRADVLQEILANGEITPTTTPGAGENMFSVTYLGESISAVFETKPRAKGVYPNVAAYRLDVLLGLDMVPVTVARKIGDKEGSLQFVPGMMQNDVERNANRKGGSAWCPLGEQWQAMYLFDALIFNKGRHREYMSYSVDNWQLILTRHKEAFTTNRGLPVHVANFESQMGEQLKLGGGWRKALLALTEDRLNEQLGDVLDERRIRAVVRRRDDLLKR
jgi:Calcineurin-like phosphoesterase